MNWREQVAQLEWEGNFDIAIFLLEKIIRDHPDEMDAYLFLLYRFMDSFLENSCYWSNVPKDPLRKIKEEYFEKKIWGYVPSVKGSLEESYARFSHDPAYLFYSSKILRQFYWYIGLQIEEPFLENMYQRATESGYNTSITTKNTTGNSSIDWALAIVNDPSIKEQLATKGAAAKYVVGGKVAWAKKILEQAGIEE